MPKARGEREKTSPAPRGLLRPAREQGESPMPSQGDHVQMMIELLQPTGPDLARRWLAALLLVPREDREAVVESVEERIASTFAGADDAASSGSEPQEIDVVHPPVQRDGFVEQVRTTYAKAADKPDADTSQRTDRAS